MVRLFLCGLHDRVRYPTMPVAMDAIRMGAAP